MNVPTQRRTQPAIIAALVFLVALNLRTALTGVGPLLPRIAETTGLNEGMLGLLGALPLIAFAVISPLVHQISHRIGTDVSVFLALLLLAAGVVVRSFTGIFGLWLGTFVLGSAIAIGNVLVPVLIRRDYHLHVSRTTGLHSTCMGIGGGAASALAVPLATPWGWEGSLALWAILALVVALIWLVRLHPVSKPAGTTSASLDAENSASVWRSPRAWLLTAFMGLQSTGFYVLVTWLPTIEIAAGISPDQAGIHLSLFTLLGIPSGLAIPYLMRGKSKVMPALVGGAPMLLAIFGLIVAPEWALIWAIFAGLSSGSTIVVVLALISLTGNTPNEVTRLSGMTQSLGYLLAAGGPFMAGFFAETTGGWAVSLLLLAALTVLQLVVSVFAGRVPAEISSYAAVFARDKSSKTSVLNR